MKWLLVATIFITTIFVTVNITVHIGAVGQIDTAVPGLRQP
jgi:hypothetical protein